MDFVHHLRRQIAFSRATFGHGRRQEGVIDHIKKELSEIEESDGDPEEWADVVILALDGMWRSMSHSGHIWHCIPDSIARAIVAKQCKNEQRDWPDWRLADPSKAIEHIKSPDSGR